MKQKSKQPHLRVYRQIPMLQADPAEGLSPQETKLRQSNGLSNIMPPSNTKSEGQIIKENVLTFFNLIFLVLALCLCLVGSFKNLMFLLVAVANTVVGSFQEIRAKRAVDKLTLVAAGTAKAIRSGQRVSVRTDQLVRDDIVEFAAGDQICADAVVRDGQLQVNESLLTGEADAILKNPGDTLKSGSFVISGRARVQLTHVGSESYAAKLAAEARRNVRSTKSEMMLSLTKLITVVGIALIPLGIILFLRHFLSVFQGLPLRDSVESTVSALIGMIPEGLYLLTSVAIAASCLKLSRKRVLVQDMNCIETLAHVDVLCVDKTGTITVGNREAIAFVPLQGVTVAELAAAAAAASIADETPEGYSITRLAKERYNVQIDINSFKGAKFVAFSAQTRMSGLDLGDRSIRKGAMSAISAWLRQKGMALPKEAEQKAISMGRRGATPLIVAENGRVLGIVELKDVIKTGIRQRFNQLRSMGIRTVMLTGDNRYTAAAMAAEAGLDDYVGEATPEDKLRIIRRYQAEGKLVAMTGDGTNDAPALAKADVAVAMGNGTQAAKEAGNMIDLDSSPTKLLDIIDIGKQMLLTRGALTTFSVSNDIAKYFSIIPAAFATTYPELSVLNVMHLSSPESAVLSTVIFNALIILLLIPVAIRGVHYKASSPIRLLRRNVVVYGFGGLIVPFVLIKAIDMALAYLGIF